MRQLRKILFPLSLIYSGVTVLRNKLYDSGVFRSYSYPFPVICVGNLSVGGTGKSPMIEYLIVLLKDQARVSSLSRGYKRTTTGFQLLKGTETVKEVGDEPLQFKKKFPEITVAVDEKRSRGISRLRELDPAPEVILLDDAYQHREVSAGLNILLTAYGDIYEEDHVLPAGNLREPKSGAKRAHLIVVTKCPPDLDQAEKSKLQKQLRPMERQELFFTRIAYEETVFDEHRAVPLDSFKGKTFVLVTGIANPKPLVEFLKLRGLQFEHLAFSDHHNFSNSEIADLNEQQMLLTTEKDYMRLKGKVKEGKIFYLPIKMEFLTDEEKMKFDASIKEFIIKK